MKTGCYTALVTPFLDNALDLEALDRLIDFQITNGIDGILAVGTTGESPVLSWDEHINAIEFIAQKTRNKCLCVAGTGSNNTRESISASKHAAAAGVDALLLVDPYYNGPSSLEIRREYVAPIAGAYPDIEIIPYIIPGRTGAQLLPEDLGLLARKYANVNMVKEATANLDNMRRTRECCGPEFTILSGDDGMTFEMMQDPDIGAAGVISVISNIAPAAVTQMVHLYHAGDHAAARKLNAALAPLFSLVTVTTTEETPYGEVVCRARNPIALKSLMALLGMPSGGCRQPLGKMTRNGLDKIIAAAKTTQDTHPEIFKPLADYFGVDIEDRLNNPSYQEGLFYNGY